MIYFRLKFIICLYDHNCKIPVGSKIVKRKIPVFEKKILPGTDLALAMLNRRTPVQPPGLVEL